MTHRSSTRRGRRSQVRAASIPTRFHQLWRAPPSPDLTHRLPFSAAGRGPHRTRLRRQSDDRPRDRSGAARDPGTDGFRTSGRTCPSRTVCTTCLTPGSRVSPRPAALLLAAALSARPRTCIAAASDDPPWPHRSCRRRGGGRSSSSTAVRVAFSHPLFASVVQAAATPDVRRSVHRRLATIVPDEEERAHHLAVAATDPGCRPRGPLEAAGLPDVSARALRTAAPALLARAQDADAASTDLVARGRRAILEAEARMEAGDLAGSSAVLERARAVDPARASARRGTPPARHGPVVPQPGGGCAHARGRAGRRRGRPDASRPHPRSPGPVRVRPSKRAGRTAARPWRSSTRRSIRPASRSRRTGSSSTTCRLGFPPISERFESALALEPGPPTWEASTIPALVVDVQRRPRSRPCSPRATPRVGPAIRETNRPTPISTLTLPSSSCTPTAGRPPTPQLIAASRPPSRRA